VLNQVDQKAVEPYRSGQITGLEAIDLAPSDQAVHAAYAREKDWPVYRRRQIPRPNSPTTCPCGWWCGLHALGAEGRLCHRAVLYLPFLLIRHGDGGSHLDWNVPTAAVVVSTPLKILLFCDGGWLEPAGSLVLKSFNSLLLVLKGMPMTPEWFPSCCAS